MVERVILSAHQPYAIRAMEIMAQESEWKPVYWLCRPTQMGEIKRRFGSDVVTHSYLDAAKGRPAPAFVKDTSYPFDPTKLNSTEESVFLSMLDRNDAFSQSMLLAERSAFLLDTMGYWVRIIARTNATLVIFEETPHQAIDYSLYLAAIHCGIRCIIPVRGLPDAGFLATNRIGPPGLAQEFAPGPGARNGTGAVDFISHMNVDYDTHLNMILWDHKESVREIINRTSLLSTIASLIRALLPKFGVSHYIRNLFSFENDQKCRGRSLQDSQMRYVVFLWYKVKTLIIKAALRRRYQKLASRTINLSDPFIYCSLQYQPEASTSPLAGRYVAQWLMVAQLARHLPDGWRLYVKEHPSQFSGEYARYGESFRSNEFYKKLLSYPGVYLVPLSLDSFTLIDHALAVAAPGGTVCFEAVARGKPVINFGAGFFKGCPGMWQVTCENEVIQAISEISAGQTPNPDEVHAFAAEIDRRTYPGALGGPGQLNRMNVTEEQNARLHTECWRNVVTWSERHSISKGINLSGSVG